MTEENSFESSILFQISIVRKSSKGRFAKKKKEEEERKKYRKTKGKSYSAAFMSLQSPSSIKKLVHFCVYVIIFVCLFVT